MKLPSQAYVAAELEPFPTIDSEDSAEAALEPLPHLEQVRCAWLCGCAVLHLFERVESSSAPRDSLGLVESWIAGEAVTSADLFAAYDLVEAWRDQLDDQAVEAIPRALSCAGTASAAVDGATWAACRVDMNGDAVDTADAAAQGSWYAWQAVAEAALDDTAEEDIDDPRHWKWVERIIHAVIREHRARRWTADILWCSSRLGFRIDREVEDISAEFAVALDVLEAGERV